MSKLGKTINQPDLSTVLDGLKRDIFYEMNCVNVGIIQSFNSEDQTATIRLALKRVTEVKDDGTQVIQERPVLLKCPVHILSGGGGYITFTIQAGDECIVLFNDREIDNWWNTGDVRPPTTSRMHSISDALAIVGVRSLQMAVADYFTSGIRLMQAASKIELDGTDIDSTAGTWTQNGDMVVTGNQTVQQNQIIQGNMTVLGNMFGNGGTVTLKDNLVQESGKSISAGNGATGTFDVVTVVNGIVTGGS